MFSRVVSIHLFLFCVFFSVNLYSENQPDGSKELFNIEYSDSKDDSSESEYQIVVTGTGAEKRLKDSPVVTEVISGKEIKNSSAKSLSQVMEDYGIKFSENAMGSYMRLQGLGGSKVLFLLNGRRIIGRVAKRLDAGTIPVENIKRIEIVRGPQSALYGSDGIGGVINIITKKPRDEFSGRLKLVNGFSDPSDDFFLEQTAAGNIDFSIGSLYNSLYFDLSRSDFTLDDTGELSVLPEYQRCQAGLDMSISPTQNLDLDFGGSFFMMRSDDQLNSFGGLARKETTRADGHISGKYYLNDSVALSCRVYHNYYLRNRDKYLGLSQRWEGGNYREEENLSSGDISARIALADSNELTLGFDGAYDRFYKYNLGNGSTKKMNRQAVFLQDEQFEKNLYSVIFGVRAERSSSFGCFAAPKLSGMYYLTKKFRVMAGVGAGYRAPDSSDLYIMKDSSGHPVIMGNEDLTPEKSIGSNLGFEYAVKNFFVQLNMFHNELWGEIVNNLQSYQMSGRDVYQKKNLDKSFRTGADLETRITLWDCLSLSAGYNFVYGYNRTEKRELKDQPMHTIRGKVSFESSSFGFMTYLSARHLSKAEDLGNDSMMVLDFYISKKMFGHFKVFASVDNITDQRDESSGIDIGRFYSIGVESIF